MDILESLWWPGYKPIQFLLFLVLAFLLLVTAQYLLRRIGRPVPVFGQAVLSWFTAYLFLKFIVVPPIPSTLLYTYMGLITIVLFLLISSTEESWRAFKHPLAATLFGETPSYRRVRVIAFTILPLLALIGTYNFTKPVYEEPIELRMNHPAPPRSIIVHGVTYDLQTARNPFRVDE